MNKRLIAGTLIAYGYNHWFSNCPSRKIRHTFLKSYLGSMGKGSGVQMGCRFLNGRKVHLGDRNVINFGCLFDGRHFNIQTGRDVSIGPEAGILTLGHNPQCPDFSTLGGEVTIGDYAWIGYRAIILPGVSIGEGAVIAAGAIVTKDVESYTIVGGSPAQKIGVRSKRLRYDLKFSPFLI